MSRIRQLRIVKEPNIAWRTIAGDFGKESAASSQDTKIDLVRLSGLVVRAV
jgi:hypothetical protein